MTFTQAEAGARLDKFVNEDPLRTGIEGRPHITTDAIKVNDKFGQVSKNISFFETLTPKQDIHCINTNFNKVEMKSQNFRAFPIFKTGLAHSTRGGKSEHKANQLDSPASHHHNHHRPKVKPKNS